MIKKVISPKYIFYLGTVVYLAALVLISIILMLVAKTAQLTPMILIGILFIIIACLNFLRLNKRIYLNILTDNTIQYGTLFNQAVVPLHALDQVKYIMGKIYKIRISGNVYFFYAFEIDVEYLKQMISGISNQSEQQAR